LRNNLLAGASASSLCTDSKLPLWCDWTSFPSQSLGIVLSQKPLVCQQESQGERLQAVVLVSEALEDARQEGIGRPFAARGDEQVPDLVVIAALQQRRTHRALDDDFLVERLSRLQLRSETHAKKVAGDERRQVHVLE
jgi:hypothetical protein